MGPKISIFGVQIQSQNDMKVEHNWYILHINLLIQ